MKSSDQIAAEGGPAFSYATGTHAGCSELWPGMTLRDWFAGQALGGLIVGYTQAYGSPTQLSNEVVKEAYSYADAMLAKRAQ